MAGDAQATQRRLLDAARAEFSAFGIAGARVDRIAAAAQSNKAQIYHYFGSKDALFDAVFGEVVASTLREAPLDAADLPGYAGTLFDRYEQDPDISRLATWYRLERADAGRLLQAVVSSYQGKIAAITRAQKAGQLPTTFRPEDLLALVVHTAALWTALNPEFSDVVRKHGRAHRRQVVVDAVRALLL